MSDHESGDDSGGSSAASVISVVQHVPAINEVNTPSDELAATACRNNPSCDNQSASAQAEVNPDLDDDRSTQENVEKEDKVNVALHTYQDDSASYNLANDWDLPMLTGQPMPSNVYQSTNWEPENSVAPTGNGSLTTVYRDYLEISEQSSLNNRSLDDEINPDPDVRSTCWVCYGTEADSPSAEWVNPCRCRGTTKWVHHVCLMRWIDEKQRGQSHTKVSCPQCNTEYVIYFPPLGFFCEGLQLLDRFIFKSSPAMATGVALTSLYWSATTYGAISLMQILGHKEGLDLMEKTDPLFLLVGLPTIPVIMVCGKLLPWDEYLLKLWRKHAYRIPILSYVLSLEDPSSYRSSLTPQDTQPVREIKFTRVFCGAMLFPTIAALVGKFAYRSVQGNFKRSLLGGITFVVVKGILKIYLQQRIYNLSGLRKVAEFKQDPPLAQASSSAVQPRVGPVPPN